MSSRIANGLTSDEAKRRLKADGPNEIPAQRGRDFGRIVVDVLAEPMFALLLAASVLYLFLGDVTEAVVLIAFATFSVSIALVQEVRSERVLEALRDMTSPRALVVRDGQRVRVPGREVVRGDVIVLNEGDRVPADAWIIRGDDLLVDESLLTGESAPVRKRAAADEATAPLQPGGEGLPAVFSGTLVVRGQVSAVVTATGAQSAIGKIGVALSTIQTEAPRLRRETRRIVRVFAVVGLAVSLIAGTLYGLAQGSWLDGVLSGIAVGMSLLPEEFPLVLAVFMVMGAWRIARARVLTRRSTAIQTLGAITTLCTDKTGTLTQNRMQVAHIESGSGEQWRPGEGEPPTAVKHLTHVAMLAGLPEPFDPMERAMQKVVQSIGDDPAHFFLERELADRRSVTPALLAMTQVWRSAGEPAVAASKGAPEAIITLCGFDESERHGVLRRAGELARQGMRVLAVAELAVTDELDLGHLLKQQFTYLGLVAFADPLREGVPTAVRECQEAGIRVVMITGDYPETARSIAEAAGIDSRETLTGTDIEALGQIALQERVRDCSIFARILPDQKLRIVEAMKANGDIVGMTGDGVNDAPSLRAAHIGIAMGSRGTDVAREASSIVLLDDDFGSIVKTIRLGRRIYDNLQKAMGYILAVHVPIAALALLPLAFGAPPILTPAIVAFLEMIIDPACSIVFEAEPSERNVMKRPPRDPNERLLGRSILLTSLSQGVVAFLTVAAVYMLALSEGRDAEDIRALMLVMLTLANVALIFSHRTLGFSLYEIFGRMNPWLWLGIGGVALVLSISLSLPSTRQLFRLGTLNPQDLATVSIAMVMLFASLLLLSYARVWARSTV